MKYLVKAGSDFIRDSSGAPKKMTLAGAKRLGNKNMPQYLKRAKFECIAGIVPTWISLRDDEYIRIQYCKKC